MNDVMSIEMAKDEAIRMITSLREESVVAHGIDLSTYDVIVINTSGGKDSQAMMDYVCQIANEQGVIDRVVAVHADLGRVEWKGTRELAEEQATHYGLRFMAISRPQGDLLTQIEARGMFPDNKNRYCTSDHKRGQISKLIVQLTDEAIKAGGWKLDARCAGGRKVRVLNCMGLRAEESSMRAKKAAMIRDERLSNGKREVMTWLPIHAWTTTEVWNRIKLSGVRWHPAYDLGMPRLSCVFCVFAPKAALMIAGKANPELLDDYIAVENKIGHTFRNGFPIAEIKAAIERGEQAGEVTSWNM